MSLKFWKHFSREKINDAGRALTDAIVRFDPETASEAAIAEMEENFDNLNLEFSKAKQEWQKEQREADEVQKTYEQRLQAAELLQTQVAEGGRGVKDKEAGLLQLLESLEGMQEDVELEAEEAADAKALMEELQQTVDILADKLKSARRDMKKAQNTLARAQAAEDRAKKQEDRAREIAGLKSSAGGLNTALDSLNRAADDAKAKADASSRKTTLIGGAKPEQNSAVTAALAEVSGKPAAPTSVADRLAALKK